MLCDETLHLFRKRDGRTRTAVDHTRDFRLQDAGDDLRYKFADM